MAEVVEAQFRHWRFGRLIILGSVGGLQDEGQGAEDITRVKASAHALSGPFALAARAVRGENEACFQPWIKPTLHGRGLQDQRFRLPIPGWSAGSADTRLRAGVAHLSPSLRFGSAPDVE